MSSEITPKPLTLLELAKSYEEPYAEQRTDARFLEELELAIAWAKHDVSTKQMMIAVCGPNYNANNTQKSRYWAATVLAEAVKRGLLIRPKENGQIIPAEGLAGAQ